MSEAYEARERMRATGVATSPAKPGWRRLTARIVAILEAAEEGSYGERERRIEALETRVTELKRAESRP